MKFLKESLLIVGILCCFNAIADTVTIGYQTGIEPSKVAIANGDYEKATGTQINWRRFDNGAELIRAMSSGDVDIANIGSSIIATAASRHLPIETFLVAAQLGTSEALVVRKDSTINGDQGWEGKIIAVPFVSTAHYSLLSALKHWNVDLSKVKIINLRVSEIAAAWKRGDIDAAYVWEPGLGSIKETGKVIATSVDVANWGSPTFDLWTTRKDFASKHPEFLTQFVKVSIAFYQQYQANPEQFKNNIENLNKIAKVTGAKIEDIKTLLGGDTYPLAEAQIQLLNNSVKKAIADTATFLKVQRQIDAVLSDYSPFVTDRFIRLADSLQVIK
jgi:taurine transport system substrate-binding protein